MIWALMISVGDWNNNLNHGVHCVHICGRKVYSSLYHYALNTAHRSHPFLLTTESAHRLYGIIKVTRLRIVHLIDCSLQTDGQ